MSFVKGKFMQTKTSKQNGGAENQERGISDEINALLDTAGGLAKAALRIEKAAAENKQNPDFGHRICTNSEGKLCALALDDTVSRMCRKADAILELIEDKFVGDDEIIDPEKMVYAIQSARDELADINAIVTAFRNAENQ